MVIKVRIENTILDKLKEQDINVINILREYLDYNTTVYDDQFVYNMIEDYKNTSAAIIYHMLKKMGVNITKEVANRMRTHFSNYDEEILKIEEK